MRSLFGGISLSIFAFCFGGAALHAAPVTWYLNGVTFDDGGKAFGSYVYDADTNTFSAINITTTAGSLWPGRGYQNYLTGFSSNTRIIALAALPIVAGSTENFVLPLNFPMTNAGGTINVNTSTGTRWEAKCSNAGCSAALAGGRLLTGGSVTATAPTTKRTWYLSGVRFDDGGLAFGSFVFDTSTQTFSNYNITTTSGTKFAGATYNAVPAASPGNSSFFNTISHNPIIPNQTPNFAGSLANAMTDGGGTISLVSVSDEGVCTSGDCLNYNQFRIVTTGSVTTNAPANYTKILSQFADGGGFTNTIVLTNPTGYDVPCLVTLRKDDGSPLSVSLNSDPNASVRTVVVPAHGVKFLVSSGTGSAQTGWVQVDNASQIGVMGTYRLRLPGFPDSEATVGGESPGNLGFGMPFDETQGFSTGFALVNPSTTSSAVANFVFYNESGTQIFADSSTTLAPTGHTSFMIRDRFPAVGNARGVVRLFWGTPGTPVLPIQGFVGLGLRVNPSGTFTSLGVTAQ
ncbi:MAG: hypothetical protein ABL967_03240 [Bryobacteraceae bacterium]